MNDEYHVPLFCLNFTTCQRGSWVKSKTVWALPRKGNLRICSGNITPSVQPVKLFYLPFRKVKEDHSMGTYIYIYNKVEFNALISLM